jgi:hypothetical protein
VDQQNGIITIVLSADKVGSPKAGDIIGGQSGRSFAGTGNQSLRSTTATDITSNALQDPYTAFSYMIVGNQACAPTPTPNPLPCNGTTVEDDNSRISYSNGWHSLSNNNASGGHYRFSEGGSNQHNVVLTFDTSPAQKGTITYFYATSPKGGTAEILVDGQSQGMLSYYGSAGSNRAPVFGASQKFNYNGTVDGHHKLELRPQRDVIYIDGFCLGSAIATGTPLAGPGQTTEATNTVNAGQSVLQNITLPTGTQAISIAAESGNAVPIQLVLLSPTGQILQTVNSSAGLAILEAPISQSGIYVIKTVNLSLGPVQIWTVSTPYVRR